MKSGSRTYKDALMGVKRRRKRCKNGTRRNKSGKCVRPNRRLRSNSKRTRRCPNGSRRIPAKTGSCVRKASRKSSRISRSRRRRR